MHSSRPARGREARRTSYLLAIVAALLLVACGNSSAKPAPKPATVGHPSRPNIVFILTDDLSWDLINKQFAPHIVALEKRGETFSHYFVADSLCCPSRSTIFTGLFPHDSKVVTNVPPDGGFQKFQSQDLEKRTFAVALQSAGYQTSLLGKYLNGYGDPKMNSKTAPIPPGWSDWHVSNNSGYAEFNYYLNDNGTVNYYSGGGTFGVDVLNGDTSSFIKRSAKKPFAIEVSTFAPHSPYTPAPRNSKDFPGLKAPRQPSFNANNVNPPPWLGSRPPMTTSEIAVLDKDFRRRAQAVESVDKLVADTEATLAAEHLSNDTYIVFSSDNGLHLGQHRLEAGKQTAFDSDIRVPLIVAGPGVPRGRVVKQVTQNVDLFPTFLQLAGIKAQPTDGHSLVPLLHPDASPPAWRTAALIEHHGNNLNPSDPDYQVKADNPPTYNAIRISAPHLPGFTGPVEAVYIEYDDATHDLEFYNIAKDPYEIDNTANALTTAQRTELHQILVNLMNCHTSSSCWAAASPS